VNLRPAGSIDLHLHSTASDGRCTPRELVERAARAGVSVMSVTDHDTIAAVPEVRAAAREYGVRAVSGIEITAVDNQRDIHVLGYFLDTDDEALGLFLLAQRASRIARVEAIGARLAMLGVPIAVDTLVVETSAVSGRSIGRPQVARAMVAAGHVTNVQEAFDRWLAPDRPGFVPREGASTETVIRVIRGAGGIASLAHPGKLAIEPRLKALAHAGLDAVEVFHPDHDTSLVERYRVLARELDLLVTGGSDFHGDPGHGREPGGVSLPAVEFERLCEARPNADS
jgi:predicted metal-dependent phosphoesterase TrpH